MTTEPTGAVFWPSVWTGTVAFDGFMRPTFEGNRKDRRKAEAEWRRSLRRTA